MHIFHLRWARKDTRIYFAIGIFLVFLAPLIVLGYSMGDGSASSNSNWSSSAGYNSTGGYSSTGSTSGNSLFTYQVSVLNQYEATGDVEQFSAGNVGVTIGSGCASCTATTYSYSNGNGTYNTVTTYSSSNISSSGNTGGSGGNPPSAGGTCPAGYTYSNGTCLPGGTTPPPGMSCPAGYIFYANECYPPSCTLQSNGVSCGTTAPPVTESCPAGYTSYYDQCYPSSSCTQIHSGGKNGGSGAWITQCTGTPTTACPAGYTQVGTMCYPPTPRPVLPTLTPPIVSITVQPSLVRSGESTHLTWDGGAATECAISGTDGFSSHVISDNTTISNVTEQRIYTITCDQNGGPSASASTTVNILPVWQEI